MGLALTLLDGFEATNDGRPLPFGPSPQRLLAFVALRRRARLRVHVAGMLWLDASEERARANLRAALSRLRAVAPGFVEARGQMLALAPDVSLDVDDLVAACHRVLTDEDTLEGGAVIKLLGGELLPDWYDDWVLVERERLRQLRLHALESLATRLVGALRYGPAADLALEALRADPFRESAHRLLIAVHLAEGNVGEARRQYAFCRRLLREHLGLEPSTELRELLFMVGEPASRSRDAGVTVR